MIEANECKKPNLGLQSHVTMHACDEADGLCPNQLQTDYHLAKISRIHIDIYPREETKGHNSIGVAAAHSKRGSNSVRPMWKLVTLAMYASTPKAMFGHPTCLGHQMSNWP